VTRARPTSPPAIAWLASSHCTRRNRRPSDPVYTADQLVPPSSVLQIVSLSPTPTPTRSRKATPLTVAVGLPVARDHVIPASSEICTRPASPTATMRLPTLYGP